MKIKSTPAASAPLAARIGAPWKRSLPPMINTFPFSPLWEFGSRVRVFMVSEY